MTPKPHIVIKDVWNDGDYTKWRIVYDGIPMRLGISCYYRLRTTTPRNDEFAYQIARQLGNFHSGAA